MELCLRRRPRLSYERVRRRAIVFRHGGVFAFVVKTHISLFVPPASLMGGDVKFFVTSTCLQKKECPLDEGGVDSSTESVPIYLYKKACV